MRGLTYIRAFIDFVYDHRTSYLQACRLLPGSFSLVCALKLGASMGGQAAIQYALHQPDLFSVTCALSAAVRKYESEYFKNRFPNVSEKTLIEWYKQYDAISYFENLPEKTESKTKWYIVCGDDDRLSANNSLLHIAMKSKGIPHEFRIHNGAHDWSYWRNVLPEFMMYLSDSFRK